MNPFAKSSSILLVLMTALAAGCNSGGTVPFKKGGPPAPPRCIEAYNKNGSALVLGKHAYSLSHGSRAAHVFEVSKDGLRNECVVIYADVESDREFGTLGQYSYKTEWYLITMYPGARSERVRLDLQRTGAEQANAKLNSDGTLSAF
jgi:hypothetical protein